MKVEIHHIYPFMQDSLFFSRHFSRNADQSGKVSKGIPYPMQIYLAYIETIFSGASCKHDQKNSTVIVVHIKILKNRQKCTGYIYSDKILPICLWLIFFCVQLCLSV